MPVNNIGFQMPYKSDAQRRFFHAAEARGEISPKKVREFDIASKGKDLPEKAPAEKKAFDAKKNRRGC